MDDMELPDFSGKVVIVYLRNAPRAIQDGIVLEYPTFEKRSERIFLTGRIPEAQGQEWIANCQTGVSWNDVIQYIEFRSIEEYHKKISGTKPTIMQKMGL